MAFKNMNTKRSSTNTDPHYADKLNEMIRTKAFEISQRRGGTPGRELDDWLQAEKIVKRAMNIK